MISDLFPASIRGTANSIYSSGVYLGGGLASLSLLLNGDPREGIKPIGQRVNRVVSSISALLFFLYMTDTPNHPPPTHPRPQIHRP